MSIPELPQTPFIADIVYWRTGGSGNTILVLNTEMFLQVCIQLFKPHASVRIYPSPLPQPDFIPGGWSVVMLRNWKLSALFDGHEEIDGEFMGYVPEYRGSDPIAVWRVQYEP